LGGVFSAFRGCDPEQSGNITDVNPIYRQLQGKFSY
jgi:hypothetical protein